jgi:hypothetical protein
MTELIVTHSLSLESNMAQVKESIAQTIAKYDVVVTEDRLPEAKELMAQFNKDKKQFSEQCKTFLSAISSPIDAFKAQQKEIERMYDEGRAKIEAQVKAFEAGKLEAIAVLLGQYRDNACAEKGIDPASIVVADLVKLTAVNTNKTGYTVAKATAETITQRIQAVENEILRATLAAEEKAKREREIADKAREEAEEKARQREAELLAKAERDKAEAVERARAQAVAEVEAKQPVQQPAATAVPTEQPKSTAQPDYDGMVTYRVAAYFEVKVKNGVTGESVANVFHKKITEAGFTTLQQVSASLA